MTKRADRRQEREQIQALNVVALRRLREQAAKRIADVDLALRARGVLFDRDETVLPEAPSKSKLRQFSTGKRKALFLRAVAGLGNVTAAAEHVGIDRTLHYHWVKVDEAYRAAFNAAMDMAGDRLEIAARRRAVDGVEEPVYQGGELVGRIRKFSDVLLIFLMKGANPEKYRENQRVEMSGPGGGPVAVEHAVTFYLPASRRLVIEEGVTPAEENGGPVSP